MCDFSANPFKQHLSWDSSVVKTSLEIDYVDTRDYAYEAIVKENSLVNTTVSPHNLHFVLCCRLGYLPGFFIRG